MLEIVTRGTAIAKGLQDYFTGILCKRGHVALRTVSSAMCKQCSSEKCSEYTRLNKDKLNENRRIRNGRNPEAARAKRNAWRANNLEKAIEMERRALAKVLAKDPTRYLRRSLQWAKDNPDKVRARFARRRALEKSAEGIFTAADIQSLFAAQSGKCAYCFVKLGKKYHVDHIVPLFNGGSNWPDNIQLCCKTCNSSKGSKDPLDFARYIGRLI